MYDQLNLNSPLRCFFVDDTKELVVPKLLQDVECEWHTFRSLREFHNSEELKSAPADVIVLDYYLNDSGTQTGSDAMHILYSLYSSKKWLLPRAVFNSSDSSCNDIMRKLWATYNGPLLVPQVQLSVNTPVPRRVSSVAAHFRRNKKIK
jgi:hypothetical protein